MIQANGGSTVDTQDFTKFQQKHELHRHFVDLDGPHRKRLTRTEQALLIAFYVASVSLACAFFGFAYDVLKPDEWASIGQLMGVVR